MLLLLLLLLLPSCCCRSHTKALCTADSGCCERTSLAVLLSMRQPSTRAYGLVYMAWKRFMDKPRCFAMASASSWDTHTCSMHHIWLKDAMPGKSLAMCPPMFSGSLLHTVCAANENHQAYVRMLQGCSSVTMTSMHT